MKSLIKFSLTALSVATLAACSSGGDDGTKGVDVKNVVLPTVATQTTVNPSSLVAANGLTSGAVSANELVVDGKRYSLAPVQGNQSYHAYSDQVEIVRQVEDRGQYFGFTSAGTGKQRYAFAGSTMAETRTMPTSGTARYEGDVVYSYGGPTHGDADIELWADFGNKKVTGYMEDSQFGNVNVNANIAGNAFQGTAATGNVSAELSGKFYGENVQGVAGVFGNKENTLGGAFGADRE